MTKTVNEFLDFLKIKEFYVPSGYTYARSNEIVYSHTSDLFYLRDGDLGYRDEVFGKRTGCVEICIPQKYMKELLQQAINTGQGKIEIQTDIEDRLGSPGWPEYQSWENNVKNYCGKAVISLVIKEDNLIFSYELPEHENHPWSGY